MSLRCCANRRQLRLCIRAVDAALTIREMSFAASSPVSCTMLATSPTLSHDAIAILISPHESPGSSASRRNVRSAPRLIRLQSEDQRHPANSTHHGVSPLPPWLQAFARTSPPTLDSSETEQSGADLQDYSSRSIPCCSWPPSSPHNFRSSCLSSAPPPPPRQNRR
uniref:Uncharacterized protein n=1 Tax=Arundo donax TaxID=35708 RepID=A0A0A8YUN6_ARUDO